MQLVWKPGHWDSLHLRPRLRPHQDDVELVRQKLREPLSVRRKQNKYISFQTTRTSTTLTSVLIARVHYAICILFNNLKILNLLQYWNNHISLQCKIVNGCLVGGRSYDFGEIGGLRSLLSHVGRGDNAMTINKPKLTRSKNRSNIAITVPRWDAHRWRRGSGCVAERLTLPKLPDQNFSGLVPKLRRAF